MTLRRANIARIDGGLFDVLVVGAGINGAVSAASLAGRGASVALIDRGDFGSFTSQESSNLVWGGFKYLENYELPLVFELCRSRNRLMKAYPDNIKEIAFLATLDRSSPYRPWFAALGATAYWAVGLFGTRPPRCSTPNRSRPRSRRSTRRPRSAGSSTSDAYLIDNDSRFVFSFVRSAIDAGAAAANYVELVSAERVADRWVARLRNVDDGDEFTTSARVVVNAAGPFVDELNQQWGLETAAQDRLLEGHPPRRPAAHHHPPRPRARVLRRHPAALLRHPDGPSLGDRHDRHARRHAVHTGRPPTTASSCSSRSTPASTCPSR